MNHLPARRTRSLLFVLLSIFATACGTSSAVSPSVATTASPDSNVPTTTRLESTTTTMIDRDLTPESSSTTIQTESRDALPIEALQATVDQLPASLRVEGTVLGVSRHGQTWIGAAGVDDTTTGTPMTSDRRFRVASITKLYVDAVILSLVDEGALSLGDHLDRWYPTFPNANGITIQMLMNHTAGVTTDWWLSPDLLQVALDDLSRTWTPSEVIELMGKRPPLAPPGGPALYSNTGFVLLGEIAAQVAGKSIGALIDDRIIRPLGLQHTTFEFDNPPDLAHGYYDFQGHTIDVTAMPMQAMLSMAGAAGAIQTDATDLLTFVHTLLGTTEILSESSRSLLSPSTPVPDRFLHGVMGFCPCETSVVGTLYSGWGHSGDIPGFFSVAVYFPASDTTVVVFVNRDIVDGVTFGHDALDGVVEQLANLLDEKMIEVENLSALPRR